jgi:hypothetical protein
MRRCCTSDLIEHDADDLRDLPLIERKRRLARLPGRAKWRAIQFTEHLTGDGPTVFAHVCRMGLGVVSKRADAPYRSGPSKAWLKSKNSASEAVRRAREEEWRQPGLHAVASDLLVLDRLARSTRDLLNTLAAIGAVNATFRSLHDA